MGERADALASDVLALAGIYLERTSAFSSDAVAVVTLDEETHARQPFASRPRALWSPYLARLVDALREAGASVIGLDLVLATTAEAVDRNYDRPLFQSLRRAADAGKIVAAEVRNATRSLVPARAYVLAMRAENIHPANVLTDADGVVRRMPLVLSDGTTTLPAELARRHAGPQAAPLPRDLPLVLPASSIAAPSFSLADLYGCIEAGRTEFLRRWFAGRVVLIGAELVDEDRLSAGNRLAIRAVGKPAFPTARCMPAPENLILPSHPPDTMAGVQILAAAVEQLLAGLVPNVPERLARLAICVTVAGATAILFFAIGSIGLAAMAGIGIALLVPIAALLVAPATLLPAGAPPLASLVAAGVALTARDLLGGHALRRLRRNFSLYLPRTEVDRMLATDRPALGGEDRDVTVLFIDIAGYSTLAEKTAPAELVTILNGHFARLGDAITRQGGFVFQYLGDGLLAVFGAPGQLPDHPRAAIAAAIDCVTLTDEAPPPPVRIRIGIATGTALVGNIGSPHRFNYAVVGDVVNLASRLEGLNKAYGTTVLLAEGTARRGAGSIALREIDWVQVVGREGALAVFEPRPEGPEARAADLIYAEALAAYRRGDFVRAQELFAQIADRDPPARALRIRSDALSIDRPSEWSGVFGHKQK